MGGVWELDLDPPEKIVLLAMADHADHEGRHVFPSVDLISWKTGYSPRQVQRIIRDLEKFGLLIRMGDAAGGRGVTNRYRIALENGVKLTPFRTIKGDKRDTEKGDIHAQKGDMGVTRTVREPSVRETTPLPPTRPTYADSLNGEYRKVVEAFKKFHPDFTEGWFRTAMAQVEGSVGPLDERQVYKGVCGAMRDVSAALKAEKAGKTVIGHPRRYAQTLLLNRMKEQTA
jgi:hypothetical protein